MGEVYRACDTKLDRIRALKVFPRNALGTSVLEQGGSLVYFPFLGGASPSVAKGFIDLCQFLEPNSGVTNFGKRKVSLLPTGKEFLIILNRFTCAASGFVDSPQVVMR
jgi:hypothetical protein